MTAASEARKVGASASTKPVDPAWAWAVYEPDARRPWNLPRAGHLYRRAAFGAGWDQLQRTLKEGPQRTVDRLLRPDADVAAFNRVHDAYEASTADSASADTLRSWWLRRMIETPHPLLEKMTLFWHGHFAASNVKVKSARLMRDHVQLLRRHALGSFKPLLEAVSRDPAMLLGLDSVAHRKSHPSVHHARALLEVFSLGPDHAVESDISEAARAFTGWFVLRGRLRYIQREHDGGLKRILGQEGNFDGKDVVRIALEQPVASRYLVKRLYRWLISEDAEPEDRLLEPLAESFAGTYDVGALVETILRSNLFHSPLAYRRRIKSPVEFALGMVAALEGMIPTTQLGADLAGLGQNLFHPPTVRGWPAGRNWVNSATMLGRSNLARALLARSGPYGGKLDPQKVCKKHGQSITDAGRFLLDLFLQGDVDPAVRDALLKGVEESAASTGDKSSDSSDDELRRLVHSVVTLPEYHLS